MTHRNNAAAGQRWRIAAAANAAILATAVGVAWPAPVRAETVDVTAANLAFAPASVTVGLTGNEPGFPAPHAHVVWTMADAGTQHTVTFDDPKLVSSGPLGAGTEHEVVIAVPGTYAYRCTIHPTMTGTVVVSGQAAAAPAPTTAPAPAPPPASTAAPAPAEAGQRGSSSTAVTIGIGAGLAAGAAGGWLLVRRRRRSIDQP